MDLREVVVEPVATADEGRYQRLMQAHHYLGALPKIGETQWYVARWRREWVALIGFSAPALKCRARDAWIGWDFRVQYDRLHLVTDNSRFLILPGWHRPNLASRLLSLCERRLVSDWPRRFGHPLLLLETFVDPSRFQGTIYRASNWLCLGHTRGYRRVQGGYSATPTTPKLVFARPLSPNARVRLTKTVLDPIDRHGGPRIMLAADTMRALPMFFADIDDPRRRQGRRHPLPTGHCQSNCTEPEELAIEDSQAASWHHSARAAARCCLYVAARIMLRRARASAPGMTMLHFSAT